MPHVESRWAGRAYLTLSVAFLAYYTLWVLGLPFVEPSYFPLVKPFFPWPVSVALGLPALTGTLLFGGLLARAYWLVRLDRARTKRA